MPTTRSPAPRIPRIHRQPMDYLPQAAHAATEVGADDKPAPGRLYLWPAVLILAVAAASFLVWVAKR